MAGFSESVGEGEGEMAAFRGESGVENKRAVKCGSGNRCYAIGHDPWAISVVPIEFQPGDGIIAWTPDDSPIASKEGEGGRGDISKRNKKGDGSKGVAKGGKVKRGRRENAEKRGKIV